MFSALELEAEDCQIRKGKKQRQDADLTRDEDCGEHHQMWVYLSTQTRNETIQVDKYSKSPEMLGV